MANEEPEAGTLRNMEEHDDCNSNNLEDKNIDELEEDTACDYNDQQNMEEHEDCNSNNLEDNNIDELEEDTACDYDDQQNMEEHEVDELEDVAACNNKDQQHNNQHNNMEELKDGHAFNITNQASDEMMVCSDNGNENMKATETPHNTSLQKTITIDGNEVKLFSEFKNHPLILGLIDRNRIHSGRIFRRHLTKIQQALQSSFLPLMKENPGPSISCRFAGVYETARLYAFADKRSIDIFSKAVTILNTTAQTAKYELVDLDKIPKRPTIYACVPAEPRDWSSIFKMIKICNPKLPTKHWRYKSNNLDETTESRQLVINVDKWTVEYLEECKWIVNYGFSSITFSQEKISGPVKSESGVIDLSD